MKKTFKKSIVFLIVCVIICCTVLSGCKISKKLSLIKEVLTATEAPDATENAADDAKTATDAADETAHDTSATDAAATHSSSEKDDGSENSETNVPQNSNGSTPFPHRTANPSSENDNNSKATDPHESTKNNTATPSANGEIINIGIGDNDDLAGEESVESGGSIEKEEAASSPEAADNSGQAGMPNFPNTSVSIARPGSSGASATQEASATANATQQAGSTSAQVTASGGTATAKATTAPTATAKATATVKATAAPTATPKVTAKPTATVKVTVKPTATVKATATASADQTHIVARPAATATPAPNSGLAKDKCSMIDYTKKALPSESYQTEVSTVLGKLSQGYGTSFSTGTHVDVTAVIFSHRYILGTVTLSLTGYKSTSTYTVGAQFKSNDARVQYLAALAWGDFVISELGINTGTTQRDAIVKINKYLADYLEYDFDSYNEYVETGKYNVDENIYTSIQTGIGVCEHYAQMFQLLCHKCGIQAYYEANEEQCHAYNYVIFSDNTRLYIDSTWNDAIETTKFNISGKQYADIYAAADGIWSGISASTVKKFSSGLQCDKQGFIDYYTEMYLSRYLLLTRTQFISIHTGWSTSDHYYNYETHSY